MFLNSDIWIVSAYQQGKEYWGKGKKLARNGKHSCNLAIPHKENSTKWDPTEKSPLVMSTAPPILKHFTMCIVIVFHRLHLLFDWKLQGLCSPDWGHPTLDCFNDISRTTDSLGWEAEEGDVLQSNSYQNKSIHLGSSTDGKYQVDNKNM